MLLHKIINTLSRTLGTGNAPLQVAGDDELHSTYPKLDKYRAAAVLLPLVMVDGEVHVILIERGAELEHHPSQISFPGGRVDDSDVDIIATALREAQEEIALPPSAVQVLGTLPLYPTRTGFMITPVVGALQEMPTIVLDPNEVASSFTMPLSFFADFNNRTIDSLEFDGFTHQFFVYETPHGRVWGAAAGILISLVRAVQSEAPVEYAKVI